MLSYRTFCNTDPPVVTELWRSRAGQRGLLVPVSPDLFEQLVFAKLYFDYDGLIIARDDDRPLGDRPVGFIHAGFSSNEAGDGIYAELGVICLVLVRPDCNEAEVAAGLLERAEAYLCRRGARMLYGGAVHPLNPFYLGLYGGSELPGVLDSDRLALELFASHGYRQVDQTLVYHRQLSDFVSPIDRRQMQIRRQMIVEMTESPLTQNWWEACTIGEFDLIRFELMPRNGGTVMASATFRTMEPAGSSAFSRATGLIDLSVDESVRRRGMAIFLMSEAFRQFARQGIEIVEAQCGKSNEAAAGLYRKLGLQPVGLGSVFCKPAEP